MKKIIVLLVLGSISLTACISDSQSSATSGPVTASPQPAASATPIPPTPASPGESITWEGLQVTMDQLEVTQEYVTDFDSSRIPPDGYKFLWVHVQLENTGQIKLNLPLLENFSVLYAATELKPTYGHRDQHTDYSTLGPVIFPDETLEGWLRFDIPDTAELRDLLFVFLPESAQLGSSYSSPNYPYALNKPTYVWKCVP